MSSDWRSVRVGDVARVIGGATPATSDETLWGGDVPWLTPKDLSDRPARYTSVGSRSLTQMGLDSCSAVLVPKGTVLLTSRAPIGYVSIAGQPLATNQGFKSLALNADQDSLYWYYMLRNSTDYLESRANGSTFKEISGSVVKDLHFRVPPLAEQRHIAGVLGALDDLIEVNRGLIQDLDDAFVSSWRIAMGQSSESTSIGEIAAIAKGLSYKGAFLSDRGLPLINMGCFGVDGKFRESGLKWYVESEVKSKTRLVKGDLVVVNTDLTQSRDILARPIMNPHEHATSTHHTFQVRVSSGEAQRFWLYCALRDESVRRRLISYATGTTVAALPVDALTSQEIPWADEAAISEWWSRAESFYTSQLALHEEVIELEATRDELLPLLMSGRVRVAEGVAA